MVAYAQALQFWAEKIDLPTEGKPCLLVVSVKELQEEMRCYLTFSNEDVFKDIALCRHLQYKPRKTILRMPCQYLSTPLKRKLLQGWPGNPLLRRPPIKFPGWEKVLHPSPPVVAAGQIPHLSRGLSLREERLVQIP